MPRGIYNRTKEDSVAKPETQSPEKKPLIGRSVHRIMLHNGVHLGVPPNARVEKMIMSASSPLPKPQGRTLADEMTLTPAGVYVVFQREKSEKLIPFANIYECDFDWEGG